MNIIKKYNEINLIKKIVCGLLLGIILGRAFPALYFVGVFGTIFVGALKALAPILVFVLVINSLCHSSSSKNTNMFKIVLLYFISTICAAFSAVIASYFFPSILDLPINTSIHNAPSGIGDVLNNLLLSAIENPLSSIVNANYIGVLTWSIIFGITLKKSSDNTKNIINDLSNAISVAINWVINFAPFGVMGLMYTVVSTTGFSKFESYFHIILVLVGTILFVAFVTNPLIVFICTRKNPYPLVLKCLRVSGIMAFFTRSSAANIPINMKLCSALNLNKENYSVSIPLGATINMAGASVTISIMTLACANTLGIKPDLASSFVLCLLASIGACGTSGVGGGSLLLIPMACSMFGISNDIAMQVVGIGFIIGVIQDSCETALNSSSDVLFTATAEYMTNPQNMYKNK
ncbi:MAG: serine/threonine transporter SstT [Eubacteriales bacterium]|nr:serine/threonine transporter SstT [Eubacteriales bacterium]